MTADDKTFILGIGAQKAGTSWLYQYLDADPAADFGALKEYHVWDALEIPEMAYFDVRPSRPAQRLLAAVTSQVRGGRADAWKLRGHLQSDPENYFGYFEGLLARPGIRITGDITPSYAGLPETALAMIRDRFAARGIDTRVVFIMRDPVNRAISAARMNRRKRDWREGVSPFGDFDQALLRYVASANQAQKCDYEGTVTRARAVFGPQNVYVGLYETMFEPDEVARIAAFTGTAFVPERVNTRVYESRSNQPVKDTTRHRMREILDPVYRYAAREFPRTQELWSAPARGQDS